MMAISPEQIDMTGKITLTHPLSLIHVGTDRTSYGLYFRCTMMIAHVKVTVVLRVGDVVLFRDNYYAR